MYCTVTETIHIFMIFMDCEFHWSSLYKLPSQKERKWGCVIVLSAPINNISAKIEKIHRTVASQCCIEYISP